MRLLLCLAVTLCPALAGAATVSGRVSGPSMAGVVRPQVRLWARGGKGFSFVAPGGQVLTGAVDGSFTFSNVPPGEYLLDTRPGVGFTDRWYDQDGSGYVAEDADVLTLTATQQRTGVDITVELSGGVDGTARVNNALAAGLQVRVEQTGDVRIHHNEDTKAAERQGEFHMRSLPPGTYRVLVHDPSATFADAVSLAPFAIVPGMNATVASLNLLAARSDPYEPNNTLDAGTPFTVTRMTPFTAAMDTRIGPRNMGDVDWYCTTAAAGERFIARATGTVALENGGSHESPWVDPVLSAWRPTAGVAWVRLKEDDDSGPFSLDALLDTGELTAAGPLCFAVSTYGDTTYTGTNQGSAGPYSFSVTYGNRGPSLSAQSGGQPLPSTVTLNEGELLQVDVSYADPEGDALSAAWTLKGASGASVSAGSFNTATGMNSLLWRAPQTAARDSPYVLTLTVADAEVTRTVTVTVVVLAVNVAPSTPLLLAPADGGRVPLNVPALICQESLDRDEETLTYDFELYYGDGGAPAQTGTVVGVDGGWIPAGGPAGSVTFTPTPIPENSQVRWRARAFDGHAGNGYSPWSAFWAFTVDVTNEPPGAPVLIKPGDGDRVLTLRPTLSVTAPLDPEGDAYALYFEVASDPAFSQSIGVSPPVAVAPGPTTMWTFDRDLEWGAAYYARAWAHDVRNAKSAFSNVNMFRVRANMPPSVPAFLSPDAEVCDAGFIASAPTAVQLGAAVDPEMDAVRIQLRAFAASDDPMSAAPLFDLTRPQTTTQTLFDLSAVSLPKDVQHRLQARAVDAHGASAWSECLFTVGERPSSGTGGGGEGTGGGGTGGGAMAQGGGCQCGTSAALPLVLGAAALWRRRRRAQAGVR